MMKSTIYVTGMVLASLMAVNVYADDCGTPCAPAKAPAKSVSYVMAQYAVPSLSKKSAKQLARAVAKQPGLVSAKPDMAAKTFSVVFETGKTSSAEILDSLKKKAPGVTLGKEGPFETKASASACAGCPSSKSCASAKAGE